MCIENPSAAAPSSGSPSHLPHRHSHLNDPAPGRWGKTKLFTELQHDLHIGLGDRYLRHLLQIAIGRPHQRPCWVRIPPLPSNGHRLGSARQGRHIHLRQKSHLLEHFRHAFPLFSLSSSSQEGQRGQLLLWLWFFVFKGRPPGFPPASSVRSASVFLPLCAIAPTSISWHKNRSLAAPIQIYKFSKILSSVSPSARGKIILDQRIFQKRFPSLPVPAFSVRSSPIRFCNAFFVIFFPSR